MKEICTRRRRRKGERKKCTHQRLRPPQFQRSNELRRWTIQTRFPPREPRMARAHLRPIYGLAMDALRIAPSEDTPPLVMKGEGKEEKKYSHFPPTKSS